jgi:aryl-alcohol dehydrogenase-like predicted oxidoreductase
MRTVNLDKTGMTCSVLGFGCAAMMGRVGRRASLAALGEAYDAGVTFYDTARSYGYGESEALLGEFLRGRRESVVVSTKFGILPPPANLLKQALKPLARGLLRAMPSVRKAMQGQIAAQFSAGHFTVDAMRSSVEMSLRKLQTGYVDLLFLHLPPVSVLQQQDLFAALEDLHVQGKVLRYGIAADPAVALATLAAKIPGLSTVQAPCNLFDMSLAEGIGREGAGVVAIANHPFGGPQRVAESKRMIQSLSLDQSAPESLREKLSKVDDAVLADLVLNAVTTDTGIQLVVPSMLRPEHLRANVAAMEQSRFTAEELGWVRAVLGERQTTERESQARF